MSLSGKVAKGVSWLAVAQIAQRSTTLIVTAVLARHLFPHDFGLISLALVAVNFFSYFQDMGLSSSLVQRNEISPSHLSSAFLLNLGAGIALGILGVAFSPVVALAFREPRLTTPLAVMMITMPINGLGWTSYALLQRKLAFREIAIVEWLSTLLSGGLAIGLVLSGAGVWSLVAQNLAASIVTSAGRIWAAGWIPRLEFRPRRVSELFEFGWGALGYFLVNHGLRNVDKAIIGAALGTTALGYYALAFNLVLMPGTTVCGLVGRVMFPALSTLQDDLTRFRRAYLGMARTVASITFPLIIGLGATSSLFVAAIYGDRWLPSARLIEVLITVGLFEAISIWGGAAWALGKTKLTFYFALMAFTTLSIAFMIGVRGGIVGVAWAYVVVTPVVFILPHMFTNRLMRLRFVAFIKAIAPPLFSSAVMGGILLLMRINGIQLSTSRWLNLVAHIAVGAFIYSTILLTIALLRRQQRGGLIPWLIGRDLSDQAQGVHS